MSTFKLDRKHQEMYKRQMIKLLEKAASNYEQADEMYNRAWMSVDNPIEAAKYEKIADGLVKEADEITAMFPEFSMDSIQEHRKIEA